MSITAISFYWRSGTPSFATWRSRLATAPDTPTCIVIHGGQFTGGVHPPNQFVPEIISPLPCSPTLVRHALLVVYFFKEYICFDFFFLSYSAQYCGCYSKHFARKYKNCCYNFINTNAQTLVKNWLRTEKRCI